MKLKNIKIGAFLLLDSTDIKSLCQFETVKFLVVYTLSSQTNNTQAPRHTFINSAVISNYPVQTYLSFFHTEALRL